ncbi:MAG: hypothetical protein HUU15_11110 [Candidatus Brocadiae bacterium]|nr:hypothetical protein [Candidatus Brocadiia bacterium]
MRTLTLFLLAAALVSAETASQQAYDVSALTRPTPHFAGTDLGFGRTSGATGQDLFSVDEDAVGISGDELVFLIRESIARDTWDEDGHAIVFENGLLHVSHGRTVHDQVRETLAHLRSKLIRTVVVEADVVLLAPGVLDGEAGGLLGPERARAVDAALADATRGRLVATLRAVGLERQRVHVGAGNSRSLAVDSDIYIANRQAISDPIVGVEIDGTTLDVQSVLMPDGKSAMLTVRFSSSDLTAVETFETGEKITGNLELPRAARAQVRTTVVVPLDRPFLLTSGTWPAAGKPGWTAAVILRAGVRKDVEIAEPKFSGPLAARLVSTRALTTAQVDFAGPRLGLPEIEQDGTAVGATFVLDEADEGVHLDHDLLIEMIRANVAPESWGRDGVSIEGSIGGDVIVVQTPEVLAQVEAFIARLSASRAGSITVETWVLALSDEGWARHRAGLSGTEIPKETWDQLQADAAKNAGVRIAGSVRGNGLNGIRWHAARGETRAFVVDYDAQVAIGMGAMDPVVGTLAEGVSMDVRALLAGDGKQVRLDLRPSIALGSPLTVFEVKPGGAKIQQASVVDIGMESQMMVTAGQITLAGMSRREDGDRKEMLVLLVRARLLGE